MIFCRWKFPGMFSCLSKSLSSKPEGIRITLCSSDLNSPVCEVNNMPDRWSWEHCSFLSWKCDEYDTFSYWFSFLPEGFLFIDLYFKGWFMSSIPKVNCIILHARYSLEKWKREAALKRDSYTYLQLILEIVYNIFIKQSASFVWFESCEDCVLGKRMC